MSHLSSLGLRRGLQLIDQQGQAALAARDAVGVHDPLLAGLVEQAGGLAQGQPGLIGAVLGHGAAQLADRGADARLVSPVALGALLGLAQTFLGGFGLGHRSSPREDRLRGRTSCLSIVSQLVSPSAAFVSSGW